MKAIMLKDNALCIKAESTFEEDFLKPIIEAFESKQFQTYASTDEPDNLVYITIEIPKKK